MAHRNKKDCLARYRFPTYVWKWLSSLLIYHLARAPKRERVGVFRQCANSHHHYRHTVSATPFPYASSPVFAARLQGEAGGEYPLLEQNAGCIAAYELNNSFCLCLSANESLNVCTSSSVCGGVRRKGRARKNGRGVALASLCRPAACLCLCLEDAPLEASMAWIPSPWDRALVVKLSPLFCF